MFRRIGRWFTAGRDRDAAQAQVAALSNLHQGAHAAAARARADAAAQRADLIAALVTDYYHADALAHLGGLGSAYQVGICTGVAQALGHVTGIDIYTLQFRPEHGIPITDNWLAVNEAPVGSPPRIVLRHPDGVADPRERLGALREQALKARRHPLAREYPCLLAPAAPPRVA